MFSRAAKSIVKSISQRKYHVGDENKLAMIGGTGGIGRSLSQMLKQTSKLNVLALYDVASLNKRFLSTPSRLHTFNIGEPIHSEKSRLFPILEQSYPSRGNVEQIETQELIDSLHRLPIAEECATEHKMKTDRIGSQGHKNADAINQRGPRVLGEMGPDNFRPNSRIVSELRRQFPDFITYLSKDYSKNTNPPYARRQCSNIAFLSDEKFTMNRNIEQESHFVRPVSNIITSFKEKIVSSARNNFITEDVDKRCCSKKKKGETTNKVTLKQVEKEVTANVEHHRLLTASKSDKKKTRAKKSEPKTRSVYSSGTKSKNWTIPAILSDKKPKMLYGLVQQRRRSLSWFFYKFFDVNPDDTIDDIRHIKSKHGKINKMNCVHNQKHYKQPRQVEKLNVSTSMSDFTPQTSSSPLNIELNDLQSLQGSSQEMTENKSTSSTEESTEEYEINSDTNHHQPPMKISSRIAEFLENLRTNRRRLKSSSSLTSYNLDSLFTVQDTPIFSVLYSSKDSKDSGSWLKNKICSKLCDKKPKSKQKDDICKKRRSRTKCKGEGSPQREVTCKRRGGDQDRGAKKRGSGDAEPCKATRKSCSKKEDKDPCKKFRQQETDGKPCKREQQDSCKKFRQQETDRKPCKREEQHSCKSREQVCAKEQDPCKSRDQTCAKEQDPCKKPRKEDVYGRSCKDIKQESGQDSCAKARNAHGTPCKKTEPMTDCAERRESSCSETPKKKDTDFASRKAMMKKKKKKKTPEADKCPPVIRAPGCPTNDGKSDGNRKFSTVAPI